MIKFGEPKHKQPSDEITNAQLIQFRSTLLATFNMNPGNLFNIQVPFPKKQNEKTELAVFKLYLIVYSFKKQSHYYYFNWRISYY
jgi:hypothetical protein